MVRLPVGLVLSDGRRELSAKEIPGSAKWQKTSTLSAGGLAVRALGLSQLCIFFLKKLNEAMGQVSCQPP